MKVGWIVRYIHFHQKRHPRELGADAIAAFLSHLAVDQQVAAATQNQARSALLFLCREVLGVAVDDPQQVVAAKAPRRLPTVLTRDEAHAVLAQLSGINRLMAQLLYGSGLRLMECVRLRVTDLDFTHHQIVVRAGKGMEDRVTMLPVKLCTPKSKMHYSSEQRRRSRIVSIPGARKRFCSARCAQSRCASL